MHKKDARLIDLSLSEHIYGPHPHWNRIGMTTKCNLHFLDKILNQNAREVVWQQNLNGVCELDISLYQC